MLCQNVLLVNLIVLPARFLACQTGTFQGPDIVPLYPPSVAVELNTPSLALELDRAILVLKRGLRENWGTRDQYLIAFDKTPNIDRAGRAVTDAKNYVETAISSYLQTHQIGYEGPPKIWYEGPLIGVEVQRAIIEFTKQRNKAVKGETVELLLQRSALPPSDFTALPPCAFTALPPCAFKLPGKITISARIAAGMLKTKIDPIYPAKALENHVSGTVVLDATISTKGGVEVLRVICGPASLQQAALDAVRKWTFRPYLLNNRPVEVETTINVVFAP